MGRPARAISAASPTAVMVTVFPPALGPLTISACAGAGSATSFATTADLRRSTSSGCRALRSSNRSAAETSSGASASSASPSLPPAADSSRSAITSTSCSSSRAAPPHPGPPRPHRAGQLVEDALLLLQRARLGDGELVAQLDELLRLDEKRLSGVAGVVHGAGQVRLVLGAHRQHVAVAAHRVVDVAQHGDDLLVL